MEASTQKAAAQLVIDLTERLHEAEAQVELLRGRLQSRKLSKVFRRTALSKQNALQTAVADWRLSWLFRSLHKRCRL